MSYKKIEEYDETILERMQKNYREILISIGENPDREGLQKTPLRISKQCSI